MSTPPSREIPSEEPSSSGASSSGAPRQKRSRLRRKVELSWGMRLLLLVLGWLLLIVGIAGLILPGLQGILTLLAAAAVLSLVSEIAYDVMRWCFQRWPRQWRRVLKVRRWMHRKLSPSDAPPSAEEES